MKNMRKIGKVISKVICGLCIAFLLWGVLSWGEVVSKNLNPNPQYYDLMTNLFANLFFSEKETEMLDAFRGNADKLSNYK